MSRSARTPPVTATPSAAAVAAVANLAAPAAALAKPEQAKFIDNYLSYLLSRAGHEVYRAFHTTVHAAGLSSLEWRVLATLSDGDGLTVGDLALVVLAEQSTLTKLLQRAEAVMPATHAAPWYLKPPKAAAWWPTCCKKPKRTSCSCWPNLVKMKCAH
jgi:hypothetical protein